MLKPESLQLEIRPEKVDRIINLSDIPLKRDNHGDTQSLSLAIPKPEDLVDFFRQSVSIVAMSTSGNKLSSSQKGIDTDIQIYV